MQDICLQLLIMPSATAPSTPIDDEPADAVLVSRCVQGDSGAYDELVTRYRSRVFALAIGIVKNEADAWDCSQDAFIKAWKALPKFKGESKFYTWLFRITHNVCYDWLRKRKIQGEDEFDDTTQGSIAAGSTTTPSAADRPDRALVNSELGREIHAAIDTLSEDHRTVILLREVQGLSYQEIMETTGADKLGTVMSRLHYARKKLQSILRNDS